MFRAYKPRGFQRIRAVQVTLNRIEDLANTLMGEVTYGYDDDNGTHVTGIKVPTLDGPMEFKIGTWVVRLENNRLKKMTDEAFQKEYELAVVRNGATV